MRMPRPVDGRHRAGSRGQSLVEFALLLPVLLVIALIALDFGRALTGWIVLQNAARIGANYAAMHPAAWRDGDSRAQADYGTLVIRDLSTANYDPPGTLPMPTFTDGGDTAVAGGPSDGTYDMGDSVRVVLTCDFHPITPFISAITGTSVQLGASSEFLVRSGGVVGLPDPTRIPAPGETSPAATSGPTSAACANPKAGFSAAPTSGAGGSLLVTFSDTSTSAPGCPITSWEWSFGDGDTSTVQNPEHLYRLVHSYIQGNHQDACNDPGLASTAGTGSGNLPDNCLIGYFLNPVVQGEFEAGGLVPPRPPLVHHGAADRLMRSRQPTSMQDPGATGSIRCRI
jgi:hypothetical protein